jgi:hypothetical protein
MKYYLAHLVNTEPNFENLKYIVHTNIKTDLILKSTNEKLCLHQEISVNENPYNSDRINICYEDIEYEYSCDRYHHEKSNTTIYDRVN